MSSLTLGSTRTPSGHRRSTSTSSTRSVSSTISTSSMNSNCGCSLRERRGVTFRLSLNGLPTGVETIMPKGHVEPRFDNVPRRTRALPTPITIFDHDTAMGKAGVKSSTLRDFGMGEEGWTVVLQ